MLRARTMGHLHVQVRFRAKAQHSLRQLLLMMMMRMMLLMLLMVMIDDQTHYGVLLLHASRPETGSRLVVCSASIGHCIAQCSKGSLPKYGVIL